MAISMKHAHFALWAFLLVPLTRVEAQQQDFTDPLALLAEVSETYAASPDTFHMESITESVENGDLKHDWRKVYRTVIKGPANLYRIETRSPFGSYIQVSDGKNEWVYLVEANAYLVRPLPERWPEFAKLMVGGNNEVREAWNMRTWLETDARGYKHAAMLPEETIEVEGKSFRCYVVHVTSDDSTLHRDKDTRWDRTLWIDKAAHVFRKQIEHEDSYIMVTPTLHTPFHRDTTTVYPVADFNSDFNPQTTAQTFRFTLPSGAKQVATLEPDYHLPPQPPPPQMVGKAAPDVSFAASDGKQANLSSYRGKPVLLDFWATWCGPCLLSMPSLGKIYNEFQGKQLAVLSFDQDFTAENATEYLARHHFAWTNIHDTGNKVSQAFENKGIPLIVLIDAQGKIVYYQSGSDEVALRKAIAALGPEYSSIADSFSGNH